MAAGRLPLETRLFCRVAHIALWNRCNKNRGRREREESQHVKEKRGSDFLTRSPQHDPPKSASIGFARRFDRAAGSPLSWNYHVSNGYRDAVSRGFQLHRAKWFPCFDASGLMFQANAGSYTLCR